MALSELDLGSIIWLPLLNVCELLFVRLGVLLADEANNASLRIWAVLALNLGHCSESNPPESPIGIGFNDPFEGGALLLGCPIKFLADVAPCLNAWGRLFNLLGICCRLFNVMLGRCCKLLDSWDAASPAAPPNPHRLDVTTPEGGIDGSPPPDLIVCLAILTTPPFTFTKSALF